MARIRTVKPELFRHEGLFELEQETGLPVRLAFIGLFTAADREGCFKWRPRELKLDVMPYELLDFSRVLDALVTRGFLVKYRVDDAWYGLIPTFTAHQVINNRERISGLPSISEAQEVVDSQVTDTSEEFTREPRVSHATVTPLVQDQGEGKGREGNRKGTGKGTARDATPDGFDVFWKLYPKKASRADALKAWAKLKPDEIGLAMNALPKHCMSDQWVKDAGQFIPNAATWLNKKRWEDEVRPHVAGQSNAGAGSTGKPSLSEQVRQRNAERQAQRDREAGQGPQGSAELFGAGMEDYGRDFEGEFSRVNDLDGKIVVSDDRPVWP